MRRSWFWLALAGCTQGAVIVDDTDTSETSEFDGATLRITEPASGALLALEDPRPFAAEVRDPAGTVLPFDAIAWTSSVDTAWAPEGAAFDDEALSPGVHEITAEAELPNGDRVAHTIGGVRLQSKWAGTYAGLFSAAVHTEYQNTPITVTCSGATTLVVELLGKGVTGDAACVISLNGIDVPATYLFELENDDGELSGTAGLDLFLTQVDYPCTGRIDPETWTMTLAFGGDIPVVGTIEGSVDAERVSLDVPPPEP